MLKAVAIVGHGLIGGSVALALRERLPEVDVTTIDRDGDLSRAARCELVILAAPILANLEILDALRPLVTPQTLITDTGSTKRRIVEAAAGLRFVGGHPIAGAAVGGREAARADLFLGNGWILTPDRVTDPADVRLLTTFFQRLGASVTTMAAREHDRLFASISHLPQLAVSALMDVVGRRAGAEGLRHAGAGLRDSTRLAGSPSDVWQDIIATNRENIDAVLDELIEALQALRDDERGDVVRRTFDDAARWRQTLDD